MNNGTSNGGSPLSHTKLLGLQGDGQKYQQKIPIDRGKQTCQVEHLNFSEVA